MLKNFIVLVILTLAIATGIDTDLGPIITVILAPLLAILAANWEDRHAKR